MHSDLFPCVEGSRPSSIPASGGAPLSVVVHEWACPWWYTNGSPPGEAPSRGGEIFVSVVSLPAAADPTGRLEFGVLPQPLVLAGRDLAVDIALGSEAGWTSRLAVPVDRLVTVSDVQPR